MEELLAHTINAAHAMQAVDARELSRVIVDTTVQEKAIAYPTDSRLLEVARKKLVLLAKRHGIGLRQSYARQGPALSRKAGRYAHARQFKRMRIPTCLAAQGRALPRVALPQSDAVPLGQ